MNNKVKGFTIIEVTLAILLISILIAITTPLVSNVVSRADLNSAHESLYNALLRAQNLSKIQYRNQQWRVCIDNTYKQYIITAGTCVSTLYPETIKFSSNITVSSTQTLDLAFTSPKGELNYAGNFSQITLSSGGVSKSIIVNKTGMIDKSLGQLWTPAQISTDLWLDASDTSTIILNGNTVSQWNDKSGNGRNVSQSTIANQPIYNSTGFNGLPTLESTTATARWLATNGNQSGFSGGNSLWAFVVTSMNSDTANYARLISYDQVGIQDFNQTNLTPLILRDGLTIGTYRLSSMLGAVTVSTNTPLLYATIYDGINGTGWLNGVIGTSVSSTGNFTSSPRITILSYGADPGSGFYWRGNVSEVIIGDTSLSTSDRQIIEGYLAWKWKLEINLPTGHPYKISAPQK